MNLEDTIETLARAIHEDYVRHQDLEGATRETNPSVVDWEDLPETLRESNRDQARNIGTKLAAVGCDVEPLVERDSEPVAFSYEEVELMAEMEHDRWWSERVAAGWTFGHEKDIERKRSPYLVPWEDLTEEIREYDRNAVRGMPASMARVGFRVVRLRQEEGDHGGANGG